MQPRELRVMNAELRMAELSRRWPLYIKNRRRPTNRQSAIANRQSLESHAEKPEGAEEAALSRERERERGERRSLKREQPQRHRAHRGGTEKSGRGWKPKEGRKAKTRRRPGSSSTRHLPPATCHSAKSVEPQMNADERGWEGEAPAEPAASDHPVRQAERNGRRRREPQMHTDGHR